MTLSINKKTISLLMLVVAALGFIDTSYLTFEHYLNAIPPCTTDGCETVLTSVYSVVAGVPLALFGVFYYALAVVLLVIFRQYQSTSSIKLLKILTTCGFLVSLVLLILQAFVIKAYCLYCLVSLAFSTILFVSSFLLKPVEPKTNQTSVV